jgi:hypothetical protein
MNRRSKAPETYCLLDPFLDVQIWQKFSRPFELSRGDEKHWEALQQATVGVEPSDRA